jgi:large subunit ribosomal protein L31
MKPEIHPAYYPEATVICSCGNSWKTGSTVELIHTDVCSDCHPFYTGEQRIVDTEGQVDRFYRKLEAREEYLEEERDRESARTAPETPIAELEIGKRVVTALEKAGITQVGQALELMAQGDAAMLALENFGRKSLADLKRRLKSQGFELPEGAKEPQV